jgi:Cu-Zn family superoxide dismutase
MIPPNPGPYYPGVDPYGPRVAYAKLQSKATKVEGEVRFLQQDNRFVGITGRIAGLVPGAHGLHVHEGVERASDGSTNSPGTCENIGGHFNPTKVVHGGKSEWIRHVGDLGNIFADHDGVAYFSITDSLISLSGPHSIVNRTLVVTEFGDDLGKGIKDSKINGNAGKPQACGVILLTSSSYY